MTVLELPDNFLCTNCLHHAEGPTGLYCTLFREELINNEIAVECGEFERY